MDILTELRDPRNDGHLNRPAAEEIERLREQLGNLLAVIHGDGGHHTEAVGEEQSVKDAHQVWAKLSAVKAKEASDE
jgi:hypothetical protein